MGKKLTWDNIVKRASMKHNNEYLYEYQEYSNGKMKINILCKLHGVFKQSVESHLRGYGCPHCANNVKYTKESILEKLNYKYNNEYEYDLSNFKNNESIISVKCKLHGWFSMKCSNHLFWQKCKKCSQTVYTNEHFINLCSKIHNNYYDYKHVKYENYKSRIEIICPKHGSFFQNARTHFRGHGCPSCNLSKGEIYIESYLLKNNIKFDKQKKFENCFFKYKLPFDFYLPEYNICIEYDGYQHFNPVNFFGGMKKFNEQKLRDTIKNNFCLENDIKLFRIKFSDDIDKKINDIFNEFQIR